MLTFTRREVEALKDRQGVRLQQLEERRLLRQARRNRPMGAELVRDVLSAVRQHLSLSHLRRRLSPSGMRGRRPSGLLDILDVRGGTADER